MRPRLYDRDTVLDLWAAGRTGPEIFAALGVPAASATRIAALARNAGDPRAIKHRTIPPPGDFWTEAAVATLRRLWSEGVPGAAIAEVLGTTRSAAIGKAHRIGLAAESPRRKHAATPADIPPGPRQPRPSGRRKDEPVPLGLSLADLAPGQCRWPHGDGPFVFCGHPAFPGAVYCPAHKARAYRPYEPKKRKTFTFRRARAAA